MSFSISVGLCRAHFFRSFPMSRSIFYKMAICQFREKSRLDAELQLVMEMRGERRRANPNAHLLEPALVPHEIFIRHPKPLYYRTARRLLPADGPDQEHDFGLGDGSRQRACQRKCLLHPIPVRRTGRAT